MNKELIHSTDDNLKVYLTREYDNDADVSHLGEFSDKIQERFYFDRSSGELRDSDRLGGDGTDKDGNTWADAVVADIPTRGRDSRSYRYSGAFQLGWELDDNSKDARKAYAKAVESGEFKEYGIKPKRIKGLRSGYWMAVLCMAQDAKRLEDYANDYWQMEIVTAQVEDEDGNTLSFDNIGGIESDYECDFMKEYFELDDLLSRARLQRGDIHETLVHAGQLELVF